MKKQRGLKRYYRNLEIKNDFEKCGIFDFAKNPNNWFDHQALAFRLERIWKS